MAAHCFNKNKIYYLLATLTINIRCKLKLSQQQRRYTDKWNKYNWMLNKFKQIWAIKLFHKQFSVDQTKQAHFCYMFRLCCVPNSYISSSVSRAYVKSRWWIFCTRWSFLMISVAVDVWWILLLTECNYTSHSANC